MAQAKKSPGAAATATEGKKKSTEHQDSTAPKTRQQRWRQRNPRSYLAHLTVQNAIRLGLLERQPCQVCGAEKSEAHHPDYDRPLEVQWLCRKHHKAAHRNT